MKRPQTIQVFLPSGEPRGIRIAEITTRTVQAIHVPRGRLAEAGGRSEVRSVGVYFLIGEQPDSAKPIAYIGEAEDCYARLKQHNVQKDFWQHAVVLSSLTGKFTKVHVRYLEWYCIRMAEQAGRYALDNGNAGSEPHTTEPMKAELMDAFEVLDVLTSALGFPVVESRPAQEESDVYRLTGRGGAVDARGQMVDDGFAVLAGSKGSATARDSAEKWVVQLQDGLRKDGVAKPDGESVVFVEPYTFKSPSAAASVLIGGNTNGWVAWKAEDGRTLDQIERQSSGEAEA